LSLTRGRGLDVLRAQEACAAAGTHA
jgi:hypothetical protein